MQATNEDYLDRDEDDTISDRAGRGLNDNVLDIIVDK